MRMPQCACLSVEALARAVCGPVGGMAHPPEEADGGVEAACHKGHLDGSHVVLLLLVPDQRVLRITARGGGHAGEGGGVGSGWVCAVPGG